jgi:ABC-type polysaccharide/polyol phosphate transport system ATPase subunit
MHSAGIEFHHVWKKFRRGEVHDSLRDLIPAMARRLVGRAGPKRDQLQAGDFWAVRDVSFAIRPGQALGIIGPNGAGKSTVLKILTHILRPNRGSCIVRGRIGALIEVSAGFHPDLTGRENVYLQGAIMGMPAVDIARKFDQIVEFSGLTDFIDTPVKRYSSGMNARLGFAIAAHLDPDVLVIDEVLAVGDFAFQAKAFGRVKEMIARGIPVVVVSHQLDRVSELCTEAILLSRGQVLRQGSAAEVIASYALNATQQTAEARGHEPVLLESLALTTPGTVRSGERFGLTLEGRIRDGGLPDNIEGVVLTVRSAQTGSVVFGTTTARCGVALPKHGAFTITADLQANLPPGIYGIETNVWDRTRGSPVGGGPSTYVEVVPGPDFDGTVQLNASVHLEAATPAAR